MGLDLGPLNSLTKALDPGEYIKKGINSILPKNMAVVGDLAGAAFDLKTGNLVGAARLGMDAMKDMPQATKSLQQQGQPGATNNGSSASANPNLDPSAPPNASKPIDMNKLQELLNQLLQMFSGKQDTNGGNFNALFSDKAKEFAKQAFDAAKVKNASDSSTTTTTTTTTTRESSGWHGSPPAAADAGTSRKSHESAGWRGEPRTPAPPPRTDATSTTAPGPSTTAPATSSAPAASATSTPAAASAPAAASTSGADTGQTISSLAQFNSMSDAAVRDAVIHGRISPELAKDQTAMMAIQQRMNAISEMNNLMTNMMKALHDMQMAVIQNVRV